MCPHGVKLKECKECLLEKLKVTESHFQRLIREMSEKYLECRKIRESLMRELGIRPVRLMRVRKAVPETERG